MQWADFQFFVRRFSEPEIQRIQKAYQLGATMHMGQKRRSGEDFFTHPVAVAALIAELGADADTIIATLLHDTVEDTDLTNPEIRAQFGPAVANIITGVTKLSAEEIAEKPSVNEQVETLRKMFMLMQDDVRIMVVKLMDRLHNMQTVNFLSDKSQLALAQETLEVYVKIADRLCMQDLRDDLEALSRAVLQPDLFPHLYSQRLHNRREGKKKLKEMKNTIGHGAFAGILERMYVMYENKRWDQIQSQYETGGTAVTGNAPITVAFICEDLDTCYQTLGMLHQLWRREMMSFQDFINAPSINGYRGLHTTVILQDGTRVRCKIRTREMNEYSHRGITTKCFGSKPVGLSEYLPWIKNISPATEGRSEDFWDNLQRDILGESIVIHGPADENVLVPKGATALDGAFYLFGEQALYVQTLHVNGKTVPFSETLNHAATIDIVVGESLAVERKWLDAVKTGVAGNEIRKALSQSQSKDEKIHIGKELLQNIMKQKRKGFIEEFDEKIMTQAFSSQGYESLSEVFMAIADGKLNPKEVFDTIFHKAEKISDKQQSCIVTFRLNMDDEELTDRLQRVYRNYSLSLQEIRYRKDQSTPDSTAIIKATLLPSEQETLKEALSKAGATDIEIVKRTHREIGLLIIVITLWALNPVLARFLISRGMHPLSLLTIRLLVFFFFMSAFFFIWRFSRKVHLSPIPHLRSLAVIPAIAFLGISVFTYYSISFLPPSIHLTIMRFNILLLPALSLFQAGKRGSGRMKLLLLLFVPTLSLILGILGKSAVVGLIFSIAALLSYVLLSLTMEHALQNRKVDIRSPFILFYMALFSGIVGLMLLMWQPWAAVWNALTLPAVAYVIVCVCVVHLCYTFLLRTSRFKNFTDLLLLEVPIAIVMEILLLGIVLPPLLYVLIACVLFALLTSRWRTIALFGGV